MPASRFASQSVYRRTAVLLWLAVLVCCALYAGSRMVSGSAFASNILGLLPERLETNSAWQPQVMDSANLQRSFAVLLQEDEQLAVRLRQRLAQLPGVEVEQQSEGLSEQLIALYKPYRQQLLSTEQREVLQQIEPGALAQSVYKSLYGAVPTGGPYGFQADPFNLGGGWLQSLSQRNVTLLPGRVPAFRQDDDTWYLIRGRLDSSPFDPGAQNIVTALEAFKAEFPTAKLLVSGVVFHAKQAADIARHEISTVGMGSLLGIVLLVALTFLSRQALLAIAFTLISSLLVATAVSFAVFDRIHLITLAFGSTLLGLAVDYCFHFLLKYRRHGDALTAGRLIRRGLLLSVSSSVLAYLIQLFSPFPGLRQFAVFVASGLIGAAIAVALLSLIYREPGDFTQSENSLYRKLFAPLFDYLAARRLLVAIAAALIVPLLLLQLVGNPVNDDIRLLNTSSDTLIAGERQVQQLLGGIDTQRYWVVNGGDEQQTLQKTEQLAADLGRALPVLALSQIIPSLQQQRRDFQLIDKKIYAPGAALDQLCELLQTGCAGLRKAAQTEFKPGLVPQALPSTVVDKLPLLAAENGRYMLVIPYRSGELTPAQMADLPVPGNVHFVDQVAEISQSLSGFRVSVTEMLLSFLVVFALVCFWLYRGRGVLVMGCVLIALLAGLSLSSGGGVTLFHVLALLLVLGIAMDTVIFYLELGLHSGTWLASTLSMLTSVLAFGLLSLSPVPVLHHFGSVVFFGLLASWIVTPVLYRCAKIRAPNA